MHGNGTRGGPVAWNNFGELLVGIPEDMPVSDGGVALPTTVGEDPAGEIDLVDGPLRAYLRCEADVRRIIAEYCDSTRQLDALASAVMSSAQEYAFSLARLYAQATEQRFVAPRGD